MDSTWSEEEILANYGYDSDALLREVYGQILDSSQDRDHEPRAPRRLGGTAFPGNSAR